MILDGQKMVGSWLSTTVTVKEQVGFEQGLVAVTVTVVTPVLNIEPAPVPEPLPVVAPVKT